MKPMLRQWCILWCGDPEAGVAMKPMLRQWCTLWCGDAEAGGGNETNAASVVYSVVWRPGGWGGNETNATTFGPTYLSRGNLRFKLHWLAKVKQP